MANSIDTLNNLTLSTVVTDADLLALCEHLLVCENGEPWAMCAMVHIPIASTPGPTPA